MSVIVQQQHSRDTGGMTEHASTGEQRTDLSRRDVLRGMGAAGTGAVGLSAATEDGAAGVITGGCLGEWPEPTDTSVYIDGETPDEEGPVPADGDLVVYVHGLFGEDIVDEIDAFNGLNQATALEMALGEQGVDTPVVAAMWDSTTGWWTAKERADEAGEVLADWLVANRADYDSLVVLGHSLGARVTLVALEQLADTDTSITSAGLFGGGVDPDTVCDEYATGIEASVDEGVYSYHSTGDNVVCWVYAVPEFTPALGCEGSDCDPLPAGFTDVDVTDAVTGHCNYLKSTSLVDIGGNAVPELVDNQFGFATPPATGTLAGTVTGDGDPLAGATVALLNSEEGGTVATATTNDDGDYAVEAVAGTYDVAVDEPGFVPEESTETVEGEETTLLDISLEPADQPPETGVVAGTVTDSNGPVAGAAVEAVDPDTGETVAGSVTGAEGGYAVELPVGETTEATYEFHADTATHQTDVESLTVGSGETVVHDVTLDPEPGSLTGQVTVDGDPVADATVQVEDITAAEQVATVTTGGDGTYAVTLAPGAYEVEAHIAGHQPASGTATVTPADDSTVDIEVPPPAVPPVVGQNPPLDLNGDGRYRDIYGDGTFDIFDVQALFDNLDSAAVQEHPEAFDFTGDGGSVTIFDVQALFDDLQNSESLDID
jgi:pimeloyl-ACP methyl ester carboxylesterase